MTKNKNRASFFLFLVWGAALFVFLLPAARATDLPQDPLKGRQLFMDKGCIKCHSLQGQGGQIGPDLSKSGLGRNLFQTAGVMWNHFTVMSEKMAELRIAQPSFAGQEMANLIAFLYFLDYFDEPGNPAKGQTLFSSKGCRTCHSLGGRGGRVGPRLDEINRYVSPIMVAQALWNHAHHMAGRMKEMGIERPHFEGNEMADLISYLRQAGDAHVEEKVFAVPGSPAEGEKLFASKGCIGCHAVLGKGGKVGPDLGKVGLKQSATRVAGVMWNHSEAMLKQMESRGIAWPRFSGKEMADLVAYLYFISYLGPATDPARGKQVFAAKGCVRCHAVQGQGGKVGPDLAKAEDILNPVTAMQAMWNHAAAMEKTMAKGKVAWPKFQGNEMADLVTYLASFQTRKAKEVGK